MKQLKAIVQEYQEQFLKEEVFDDSISGEIKRIQKELLADDFFPSVQLKMLFQKLLRRSKYPMEVAIVGQFSSGKSTFLNALLSKDVLPTGITPVTSKVNFINYGEEYKLKVTYNNGSDEFYALDAISQFTDQRENVEDIKYLTLYAPMDILKDLTFVDTPGLNSQSLDDTRITKKVLRDVDGIIWLTLLDNAGKQSESEVLTKYLNNFKNKSLCVLNQKDKFTPKEVDTTVSYIKERFSTFFSHVIPISAKQALDSRVNQKEVLADCALNAMQRKFKELSVLNKDASSLDFFNDSFKEFTSTLNEIEKQDTSNDQKMMEDSNISDVLNFIQDVIRPQAAVSKSYTIKKELASICDILIHEYETIVGVYESLLDILLEIKDGVLESFDMVHKKHYKSLQLTFEQTESAMQMIADTIYENIKTKDAVYYEEQSGFMGKKTIQEKTYESLYVDNEAIMQKLFYENQLMDKKIKSIISYLKNVEQKTSEEFIDIFDNIKFSIKTWQEPYELIKKNREIGSDLEFANTRQFVAKVYENITLSYHSAILGNISALHKKFAFFYGAFSYSYTQITQECILLTKENIDKKIENYIDDSTRNTLSIPSSNDILETVKKNFKFDKMELFLASNRNYLYKTIDKSKKQFEEVNNEKVEYVVSQKELFLKKIEDIKTIKESLDTQEIEDKKESL